MEPVQEHPDSLDALGHRTTLSAKLEALHATLRASMPFIDRISVALFDEPTRRLKTYVHSSGGEQPLSFYEAELEDAPALARVLESRQARVVQDLSIYEGGIREHTAALRAHGYAASYTLPFYWNDTFQAFVFFNSRTRGCFTPERLDELDLFGHLVGTLVMCELTPLRTLLAALRTTSKVVHVRDPETGAHLERMAHYARIIAQDLARSGRWDFNDDLIEHIFAFAPLHDVGKIGIPEEVLQKQTALTDEDARVMRTHTTLGREIVDAIISNFGLETLEHIDLLRHVAECHHERLDGSGYPRGLSEDEVPIEARIIAVADVFDAVTSRRSYKSPWSNQAAFGYLHRQAGSKLDKDCVDALLSNEAAVERIQRQFRD